MTIEVRTAISTSAGGDTQCVPHAPPRYAATPDTARGAAAAAAAGEPRAVVAVVPYFGPLPEVDENGKVAVVVRGGRRWEAPPPPPR
jgi:hypothetical protein